MSFSILKYNIIFNYIGRGLSVISIYLFTPFYIRILGIESFGIIYFYNVLLLLTVVADIGLSSTFTRESARDNKRANLIKLLSSVEAPLFALSAIISFMLFLQAGSVSANWLDSSSTLSRETTSDCVKIMSAMIPIQMLITLYSSGLMGIQKQVALNIVQIFYTVVRSGLVILLIYFFPKVEYFLIWQLTSMAIYALVLRVLFSTSVGAGAFSVARPSLKLLRSIAKFSAGAFAIAVVTNMNNQIDKIFVSAYFSVAEFGYYGAASSLAQVANAAVAPVIAAIFPLMVRLAEKGDRVNASRIFAVYSRLVGFVAALAASFIFMFAPDVIAVWLGGNVPDYVSDVVRWLALGWLFFAWQLMPTYLSLANGQTWPIILAAIGLFVTSLPALFLLSGSYGIVGAAVPWLLANAVAFLILFSIVIPRFYGGSASDWLWRQTMLPGVVVFAAAALSRLLADLAAMGPLGNCLIAVLCGMASLFAFVRWIMPQLRAAADVS